MAKIMQIDTEQARFNPSAVFESPADVVEAIGLTRGQKIATLQRWEQDIREQQVATTDGMPTHGTTSRNLEILDEITAALAELKQEGEPDRPEKPSQR